MDWKTQFFVFLATPLVSSLLFMGLIIGAYIEMNNPGLSLPGFIAGICLFLIVLPSFSLEIANWLRIDYSFNWISPHPCRIICSYPLLDYWEFWVSFYSLGVYLACYCPV